MPIPDPAERRAAAPLRRPRIVFARDDASGSEKQSAEPVCILLVEDDFLVASQMESALVDAGFDIAGVATTADEAIQLSTVHRPLLVVMDIRLGGKRDGVDAALELFRKLGIRCVFATAHIDVATRRRAEQAAPLAWVPKPYAMPSLVEVVRRAVLDLDEQRPT